VSLNFIPQAYADMTLNNIDCYGSFCPEANTMAGAASSTEALITMVVGFLTIVAGLAFLIYFMIGGLSWLTAGGDKGKVETAKQMMTNGAIGMIIVVAAYGIVWIVGELLGIDILNPAEMLDTLISGSSNPSPGGGGGPYLME
jgi:hypothetical protein